MSENAYSKNLVCSKKLILGSTIGFIKLGVYMQYLIFFYQNVCSRCLKEMCFSDICFGCLSETFLLSTQSKHFDTKNPESNHLGMYFIL